MFSNGDLAFLMLLGLLAGWLGGLMGVGGAVIVIPGLIIWHGPGDHHLYQAAAMVVNVFVSLLSVRVHLRAGAVMPGIVRWSIPSASLAALAGVWISERAVFRGPGQGYLQLLFAGFLCYVIVDVVRRLMRSTRLPDVDEAAAAKLPRWRIVCLVGLPAGLLGGVLGIGGGLVAVPAQQVFLKIPLRKAIANSAATIVLLSVVGAIAKNIAVAGREYAAWDSLRIACVLIPTAVAGAWVGAALVHRWPPRVLRAVFLLLMSYSVYRLVDAGWREIHARPADQNPSGSAKSAAKIWEVPSGPRLDVHII